MHLLALALVLSSAGSPQGLATRLPPAPLALYSLAWRRMLVEQPEGEPLEEGGVAVELRREAITDSAGPGRTSIADTCSWPYSRTRCRWDAVSAG